ncbi:MAG: peptidylprolyl isomerase [Bacillota bacterium]|nr:MAG: peptidylprolyl isomerase [Bacillota bacterium]
MNYTEYLNTKNPTVTFSIRDYGIIQVELFPEVAPNTVNNFIHYAASNFYKDLIFHRIIPGFMIQGGGGSETLKPIKGEFAANGFENPLKHTRGVISMARTSDPNSQTSQFFIMHQDAPHLDRNYAAFGVVTSGIEVVDQIVRQSRDFRDRPHEDIVIESVSLDTKNREYPEPVYADDIE